MEHGGFTTHKVGQASDASDVGSVFSPTIDVSTMSLRYVRYTKKSHPQLDRWWLLYACPQKNLIFSLVNGRILPCTSSYLTCRLTQGLWTTHHPLAGYAPRKSTQLGKKHVHMSYIQVVFYGTGFMWFSWDCFVLAFWRLALCDAFGVKKVDFLDHVMAVKDWRQWVNEVPLLDKAILSHFNQVQPWWSLTYLCNITCLSSVAIK